MGSTVQVLYVDESTSAPVTVTALDREPVAFAVEHVSDAEDVLAPLDAISWSIDTSADEDQIDQPGREHARLSLDSESDDVRTAGTAREALVEPRQ